MSLTNLEILRVLIAIGLLLICAHTMGYLFARFRQPPVIGEILGGLLLGPTVLGAVFPEVKEWIFSEDGATAPVLGALYQLGLLLLMFAAGVELRSVFHRGERKTASIITITGVAFPFAIGLAALSFVDLSGFMGEAGSDTAFLLVFGVAVAVTSIPVISRIMLDLGIIETPFARIVLSAAVIEDVALYVVLAVALGLVGGHSGDYFGIPALLGAEAGSTGSMVYHVAVTLAFFGAALWMGPKFFGAVSGSRFNVLRRHSPIGFQVAFVLCLTGVALVLDITPMFGAFVAGLVVGMTGDQDAEARQSLKGFAFAFFIPIYFGIVGLKLDLIHQFDPLFFAAFLAFACAVKSVSVYAGSRLAGQDRFGSGNLAVALNARGGPGIVLASVAFDAAIIDERFYVALVLLAIVTSLLAGSWLERVVRSGRPLLGTAPARSSRTPLEPAPEPGRS
jgi:Kef-type K+ transport system membrane component KefB